MFVKLTPINSTGQALNEIWVNKSEIKSMRRVAANAEYVDHTIVILGHTSDGDPLDVFCLETPATIAPTVSEDGHFRS